MVPRSAIIWRLIVVVLTVSGVLILGCAGGNVAVEIVLKVETPNQPLRLLGKAPVYPLGHQIVLKADFVNNGTSAVTLEDPKTSPRINMHMIIMADSELVKFKLHPPRMDSTFERSYDEPEGIPLKPQERVSVPVDLYHYVPDRCFSAGRIDVSLQAPDATSNVLSFLLEYCAESVPNLVKLAVDDKTDPWIREESIRLLGELPDGPEITLPSDDMTDDARLALTAKNQEVADQFLSRWPTVRMAEPVKAYFESIKLRLE